MNSFKLLPNGAGILKQFCLNRSNLFEVIDKDNDSFIVRASNKNWINHLFRLGLMIEVVKEETGEFYCFPTANLNYELLIKEVIEFWALIHRIRDKNEEYYDLRLFKD